MSSNRYSSIARIADSLLGLRQLPLPPPVTLLNRSGSESSPIAPPRWHLVRHSR